MKSKKKKIIGIIFMVIAIVAIGAFSVLKMSPELVMTEGKNEGILNPLTGEYCDELPSRPLLVSTDNVGEAVPQYGISKADIIYEVPVEGAQSRLEVLYYSDIPKTVGPCRSVRPYIVDLAREYSAILVHDGWSPQAREYISSGVVAGIPAQKYSFYYRTGDKPAPHNCLVDTKDILKAAKKAGYDKEQEVREFQFMDEKEIAVLAGKEEEYIAAYKEKVEAAKKFKWQKYSLPSLDDISFTDNKSAEKIDVRYAGCGGTFTWNDEEGVYTKTVNGTSYCDLADGSEIAVKNIIVYKLSSRVTDHKGRLDINMCEGGKAWVFTQGRVFEGKWSKKDKDSPVKFVDKEGNEIKLSPGKTWINIIDGNTRFKYE